MARPKPNKTKHEVLGLNYSTATARLKKIILFDLVKRLGLDSCFRCKLIIDKVEELSVEHKEPWSGNVELFWSLENIAYSHLKCNMSFGNGVIDGVSKRRIEFCPIEGHGRRQYNKKYQMGRCKECARIRWHEEGRNERRNKRRRDNKICELAAQGLSTREIADRVKGVSHVTVFNILKARRAFKETNVPASN